MEKERGPGKGGERGVEGEEARMIKMVRCVYLIGIAKKY